MNKLFLEKLQKKIDYFGNQLELLEKDDEEIIEITVIESYYSSLKWARDLYLNYCEENEKNTDD